MTYKKRGAPLVRNQDSLFESDSRAVSRDISSTAILDGRLVKNVVLGVGKTRVPHGLGRPFVGWKVVDQNAPGSVHRDPTDVARLQDAIPLIASEPMTVTLWVF